MQFLEELRNDPILRNFLCYECQENGIAIEVSDQVSADNLIIIRVDEFYNSLKMGNETPPSPDCLIVQYCRDNQYVIYVVELKNVGDLKNEPLNGIRSQFETCLLDFMSDRFRQYFYNPSYNFANSLNLLFISLPREAKSNSKDRTTRLDNLLAMSPIPFANRKYVIKHKVPNPVIQPC